MMTAWQRGAWLAAILAAFAVVQVVSGDESEEVSVSAECAAVVTEADSTFPEFETGVLDEGSTTLNLLQTRMALRRANIPPSDLAVVAATGGDVTHADVLHEPHEWDYGHPVDWTGQFHHCDGKAQSPIDIDTKKVTKTGNSSKVPLSGLATYRSLSDLEIINNGHAVQVNGRFGLLMLPNGKYGVKQFHFHFPSEHSLNGKLAAGEVHVVHQKLGSEGTNDLAVVSILLEEVKDLQGHENQLEFLSNLGFAKTLPKKGESLKVAGSVDIAAAFSKVLAGPYYHYQGSLTTPPCSETVHWYVLEQPMAATAQMVKTFKALFPSPANNRPVQSLNERAVIFSDVALPGEFDEKSGAMRLPGTAAWVLVAVAGMLSVLLS